MLKNAKIILVYVAFLSSLLVSKPAAAQQTRQQLAVAEMLPLAKQRMHNWYQLANDNIGLDSKTVAAVKVMARSCERILHHVNEAEKHL